MPYFPVIREEQYTATSDVQCVEVVIPDGDEYKALLAGMIQSPAEVFNYANPESAQAEGVAQAWSDALATIEWRGCVPYIPVVAKYFYAGPASGADAPPDFRPILPGDIASALVSPPTIGGTTPNTGKFTTLEATGTSGSRALILNTGGVGLDAGERVFWRNSVGAYVTALQFSGNAMNIRGGSSGLNFQNSGANAFLTMSDAGEFTFRNAIATTGLTDINIRAGAGQVAAGRRLMRWENAAGTVMISIDANARDVTLDTTDGVRWGTAATQKQAWWGATPVTRPVLPTGVGKTVDDVITVLQTMGLCSQT